MASDTTVTFRWSDRTYTLGMPTIRAKALADVEHERVRQDEKWGEQNHNPVEWLSVLAEEVGEAAQAANNCHWTPSESWRAALRHELVQVAAVAIAAVECLDREDARRG